TLSVTVTGKAPPDDLGAAERLLFDYFKSQGKVTVNTTTGPKLNETRGQFVSAIETENRLAYFRNNTGYILVGVGFSVLILLGMVVFDLIDPVTLVFAGVGALFLGILSGALRGLWRGPIIAKIIFAVWAVIFGGNLFGAAASFLSEFRPDVALIGAASIIFINVMFAVLMRAPTVQGRKIMDQLDGFKMYMNTAEKNRLNMTNEPPMTVERFERILPYAIALGVEKPWSEHFEAELARNAVADAQGSSYAPGFYTGRNWSNSSGSFANSVSSVASGMSAAMVAAQPSSSSGSGFSSGGGGGGGSGGGGGGGGGGGW
ncbi:MAG: putative rane protein precursor, partial [Devosia sp.]|nr:putative rane protein precursor [Devosia sp.]